MNIQRYRIAAPISDLCNGDIDHDMEPDADGAFVLFKDLVPSVPVSELRIALIKPPAGDYAKLYKRIATLLHAYEAQSKEQA